MNNIPVYRAKVIDSDEYIVGQYCAYKGHSTIFNNYGMDGIAIDPTTLAIHFNDMLDSEGNKIFASLSEDGKGGTLLEHDDYDNGILTSYEANVVVIENGLICFKNDFPNPLKEYKNLKIIGIQE